MKSENYESTAVGSLPANYQNSASPSGNVGNAAVSSAAPISGSRSLTFAPASDGMAVRDTSSSATTSGVVFASRYSGTGASASAVGALLQSDGAGVGYFIYPSSQYDELVALRNYALLQSATTGSLSAALGAPIADGQVYWTRAKFDRTTNRVRARSWASAAAEPTTWPIDVVDNNPLISGSQGFRVSGGSSAGVVDNVQFYDPTIFTPGVPLVTATGTTTASLSSPGADGGTGPYLYQWQRAAGGGAFANVAGATSLILNDSGLTQGTAYSWQLVVTDTGNANATATSTAATATTTGTVPAPTPSPTPVPAPAPAGSVPITVAAYFGQGFKALAGTVGFRVFTLSGTTETTVVARPASLSGVVETDAALGTGDYLFSFNGYPGTTYFYVADTGGASPVTYSGQVAAPAGLLGIVGALEPGRTFAQSLRKVLASAAGSIDQASVPGFALFKLSDGTEAFRVATTGRAAIIEGANL